MLDHVALADKLQAFEDEYADTFGERISTADFYDLYRAGGTAHVPNAIVWASYYEIHRAQGRHELECLVGRSSTRIATV